ncbi:MAG: 4-hydroxy-tetrahydrodipicolinate synthase, partial [Rhodospirillales bacterium]|nr:4-hydroxy-tetrahydrodipicolinate synthase [Rhodospirillales bacterium]
MFKGSMPALITPFANGKLDETAFQDFVEWQIQQGSHGVVPCGTTGESPTLSHDEDMRVTSLCVEVAKGRVPVIAGTGSNCTKEAIRLTRHAKQAGADAVLVVTPYYNKPTQEGLYQHFWKIADSVDIPQILYNVPSRTACDMLPETVARLAAHENIIGIKE